MSVDPSVRRTLASGPVARGTADRSRPNTSWSITFACTPAKNRLRARSKRAAKFSRALKIWKSTNALIPVSWHFFILVRFCLVQEFISHSEDWMDKFPISEVNVSKPQIVEGNTRKRRRRKRTTASNQFCMVTAVITFVKRLLKFKWFWVKRKSQLDKCPHVSALSICSLSRSSCIIVVSRAHFRAPMNAF